jgi:hypothetical protein
MAVAQSEIHNELQTVLVCGSIAVLLVMAIFMAWMHYKGRTERMLKQKRRHELARISPKLATSIPKKKKKK